MNVFIAPVFYQYYQQYPIGLVDVGASGGLLDNWKDAEKYLRVIAFEPDERASTNWVQGQTPKIKYLTNALYKERASLNFHLTREQADSSLLIPNRTLIDKFPRPQRFDILGTTNIKADTLDNQLRQHQIKDIDFIKLDTQGSELFILQGATRTLNNVFALEIEAEFAELYQDQPLFSDIDRFVRELGFQLFDLNPYYWKRTGWQEYSKLKGQVIFADTLYMREAKSFTNTLNMFEDDVWKKSKVLRAISICILYGHLDYAFEIFSQTSSLFNNNEIQLFKCQVEKDVALPVKLGSKIPNFPGRRIMARIFYLFYGLYSRFKRV